MVLVVSNIAVLNRVLLGEAASTNIATVVSVQVQSANFAVIVRRNIAVFSLVLYIKHCSSLAFSVLPFCLSLNNAELRCVVVHAPVELRPG